MLFIVQVGGVNTQNVKSQILLTTKSTLIHCGFPQIIKETYFFY